jgi:transposase InsO family protein
LFKSQKGVRTESWTVKRFGLEVRMYSREKVELFLLATEDGMGPTAAAKFAGVTVGAAKKWATGHLPHSYTGARCRIGARKPRRKEASLGPDKSIYAPPATGPLAGLNEDQIENLLLRAVLADLKAEGWDPASISNRSKCELGERLRRATALPLRSITGFLRISKSSYEYWRPRVAAPRDRDADIRDRVVRIFREGSGCWGYRTVWARLRREGVRASEKRVARVMREEGLEVVYNKRRARGYSSYAGEVSKAPENLVNRNFHADEPNRLWLTDITEFRLPDDPRKVYLSPAVDLFDGDVAAFSVGTSPSKALVAEMLAGAVAAAGGGFTLHSDRGWHYRTPDWVRACGEAGVERSMSRKGHSPDNAACEGFFGRLKVEFFHGRDWRGVSAERFAAELAEWIRWYREGRLKAFDEGGRKVYDTIAGRRRRLGLAA